MTVEWHAAGVDERLSWFALEKYENADKLTPKDWYNQISRRLSLFPEWYSISLRGRGKVQSEEALKAIVTAPLDNDPRFDRILLTPPAVHLAQRKDLGRQMAIKGKKHKAGGFNPVSLQIDDLVNFEFLERDQSLRRPRILVSVNLQLGNKALTRQFAHLLSSLRSSEPFKDLVPARVETELKNCAEYSVLPFLDLYIWCRDFNHRNRENQIPNCEGNIETLIFKDPDSFPIRTTKSYARKVFSYGFLELLSDIITYSDS